MTDDRWGDETAALLRRTAELANEYLSGLPERHVAPQASLPAFREALAFDLPDRGEPPQQVIEAIVRDGDPGVMASAGPRFFGFVIGGSLPAALAADWMTSTWDQNLGLYVLGPSYTVMEETAVRWLLELLGLPPTASVGLTTGCQMAHFVALAAARRAVLLREGWDVESQGLNGAPEVHVVGGGEAHITISIALQMLGLGAERMKRAAADEQGRMRSDALREALATCHGPTIVCAQAGNVNTGAFDPLDEIADIVAERPGTWLHVDGAFGLWAAASPALRHLVRGVERADSWATDAHKSLNVPYDSGIVAVSDPAVHRAAMMMNAAYLVQREGDQRDPSDWVPEFSRRGRGLAIYAALRSLGRDGVSELIERSCQLARRMAQGLSAAPGVEVLNEVALNQVLVRFGDDDALTRDVVRRVQEDGTCWLSGSVWQGRAVMRISVSNWSTRETDADISTGAILRCWEAARSAAPATAQG
ncbi:MAG: aminotransferase class V-fold PLP-dependent enzyme [Chloroflexota bacterium]|nr:aminotransferase class V-fold PLP-dependent enzyme [Chloroflexota bacterium]